MTKRLNIKNLGPIEKVDICLGDLTILVGPQASGKTIALETLKLVEDKNSIIDTLDKLNYRIREVDNVLNLYYGNGMASMWGTDTFIEFDEVPLTKRDFLSTIDRENVDESVFYIPAQRVISVMDGVGKSFDSFNDETPYVNRKFGETVQRFIQNGIGHQTVLFPIQTRLKKHIRNRLDESIYHGACVEIDEGVFRKRLVLRVGKSKLPTMAWSTGQREFTPLLLGMYCLTGAPQTVLRKDYYKYVIIEEPEMGLHPKAILDIILQLLVLIQGEKGPDSEKRYNVIISTHSPVFLEFAWAFNQLKGMANVTGKYNALYELLGVQGDARMKEMLSGVFDKTVSTYYLGTKQSGGRTISQDISSLDVWSDNPIIEDWGGLSTFASRATDIVSQYTVI